MLTLLDVVDAAHDTHHPISVSLTYEEQREAALEATRAFVGARLEVYLDYFESLLERGGGEWLLGTRFSYVDLALFQLVEGLGYAFPKAMRAFDVMYEDYWGLRGVAKRSAFVIDKAGIVRYAWVTEDDSVLPDLAEIREALAALD